MIRRLISFCFASHLLFGGLYFLVSVLFFSPRFYVWMPVASAFFAFIGGYWLWEDFVSPKFKKGN
jgi:hypothetical protein